MSANYKNLPRVTIVYSTDLSYITVSYYGNTTATSTVVSSGNQTSGSYTTGDLSFNVLYTFTLTPYDLSGNPNTPDNISVNTTPSVNGVFATNSTTSNTQIQWYGTYSYVKIYRKITAPYTTSYIDVSTGTNFTTVPYYDKDLSGNTTYSYIVRPYDLTNTPYTDSTQLTVTTNPQAAKDLSAIYYDTSGIMINFTAPKNSYSSSYYYQLNAIYGGNVITASGGSSPLLVKGLSGSTNYSCYILSYLDGILGSTSNFLNVTTDTALRNKFILSNVDYADSGSEYNYYVFKQNATISATIAYTDSIYVFAVGGGGAGGSGDGGGGGAGGVVKSVVNLSGSDVIHIIVGNGGMVPTPTANSGVGSNGSNTMIRFKTYSSNNIIAYGGGAGGVYTSLGSTSGIAGGSGGGGSSSVGGSANNANNNIGYAGGSGYSSYGKGGGGGAGGVGVNGTTGSGTSATSAGGDGGIGVRFRDISNIAPTTFPINNFTAYSNYYWAGGGGGGCRSDGPKTGNGGLGGGGGGAGTTNTSHGVGGGNAINVGGNCITTSSTGGNGGANTGGGGGGSGSTGGNGGSGIVIIAIPITATVSLNTTLSVNTISTTAYNSLKCIYGCNLLNINYTGPIFKLRYSTDATGANAADFYCDLYGRYTTGANNTGSTLYSWLSSAGANTTYAYIVKWYDQSVINRYDASQIVLSSQPIFDIQYQVVNFNYANAGGYGVISPQTNSYFDAPTNTWPTGDTSYTFTVKHTNFTPGGYGIVQGGAALNIANYYFFPCMTGSSQYSDNWNGPNYAFGTGVPNNVATMYYTSGYAANSMVGYVNCVQMATYSPSSARLTPGTTNTIGGTPLIFGYSKFQINYIYCFNTPLSISDRTMIESNIYSNVFPTSCVYDFDANYGITASSNSVTSWVDYNNGFIATGATNKPTYVTNVQGGLPMLSFPVNNTYVTTSTVMGSSPNTVNSTLNMALFVVLKTPSPMVETYYIGNNSTGNIQVGFLSSKLYFGTSNVGALISNGTFSAAASTVYLLAFNVSTTSTASPYSYTCSFYVNGVLDCTVTANMTSKLIYKNSWFGTAYDGYVNGFKGSIGEIMMFNKTLGISDLSNVTSYLSNKWSIPIGSTPTVYPKNPFLY